MKLQRLQNILAIVVLVLIVVILIGTAYGLIKRGGFGHSPKPGAGTGVPSTAATGTASGEAPAAAAEDAASGSAAEPTAATAAPEIAPPEGKAWFEGIGKLRCKVKDGSAIVLSVTFAFDPTDGPFSEELLNRKAELRALVTTFVSGKTEAELRTLGEEGLKAEILDRFNKTLQLGQVGSLYFRDYIVIPR